MIYEEYQEENREWDYFIEGKFGPYAQLLSVSRFSANRRVYLVGDRVVKVCKKTSHACERAQDLAGEYKLLCQLNGVKGISQNVHYFEENGWELLSYDFIPNDSLESILKENSTVLRWRVLLNLFQVIISVNRKGIAHRDIKPENILVDQCGRVQLIDFDQAIELPLFRAVFIDVLGIGDDKHRGYGDFTRILKTTRAGWFMWLIPITFIFRIVRKLAGKKALLQNRPALIYCPINNPDIDFLEKAWQIGQMSDANSPGKKIAYYSFDIRDYHFPGERPWVLRWHEISKDVNFKNKRVLELGCNLALFSAFAKRAGARECVGLDRDSTILEGAHFVSEAFHVQNEFYQVDFDSDELWEKRFSGFDLVVAFSVANWLSKRDRFYSFLGEHSEVLYEGHDSVSIEFSRLKKVGFKRIELIMISERNRAIFLASKR